MKKSSLRLGSKFYLSFGAVLMLGTLVAALMLVMLLRSSSSYKHVLDTDRRVAELALTIQAANLRISDSLRGRLLHPYGDFGSQELSNIANARSELDRAFATTRSLATDGQLLATLDQIESVDAEKLGRLEQNILAAIDRQESAEAERVYFDEYVPARGEQQELLDNLNHLAANRISTAVNRTAATSRLVSIIAVAMTVMLIIVGCVLSYYLTRSFEKPINELMKTARAIASGDLGRTLSLERNDELGEMAEVLNQMVTNLRHLNENLANQVRWLRETKDELSRTQGQLVTQEKMAALGRLVAGVAHELNNPISFVYSNSILLRDSVAQLQRVLELYESAQGLTDESRKLIAQLKEEVDYDYLVKDISQAIDDCHEGSRRVRDIVLNLRTFSRLEESELQQIDVVEGIESTIRILGQYFRPDRVVIHREYGELPKLECYSGQLSQVWMNLLVNAAQAMNSHGDLWISTRVESSRAMIEFRDSGPGMPDDIKNKIFDPFFTTKAVGEGTGLGLSIVHSIIERHAGDITVESDLGKGTTFRVSLPLQSARSAREPYGETEMANATV